MTSVLIRKGLVALALLSAMTLAACVTDYPPPRHDPLPATAIPPPPPGG